MARAGDIIATATLALLCVGVVMVASAGMSVGAEQAVTLRSIVLSKEAVFAAIAIAVLLIVGRSGTARWLSRGPVAASVPLLVPLALGLLLAIWLTPFGVSVNGAARWLEVPPFPRFQPSEIAKWALVLGVAWYGARKGPDLRRLGMPLIAPLIVIAAVAGVVTVEDLGTGALLAGVACLMLIAAGARAWHFVLLAPAAGLGFLAAVVHAPYRMRRLEAFLNPYADPQDTGYHIIQSLTAIANGEGFGRGLGFGLQKFGYLPEDRTDFLFSIICEELGIAGALVVLSLYAVLLLSGLRIMQRARTPMHKLLSLGIVTMIGGQTLMNLLVVTGLAPTKGIALPLLSAGGTGWIMTAVMLGLLVSIDRVTEAETPTAQTSTTEPGTTRDSELRAALA